MNIAEQQVIRDRTAGLVVEWAAGRNPQFTGETANEFAEVITVAHLVADEGRLTLHRWVDAARRTGLSWTDIGSTLGISKQAAQQRFKSAGSQDDVDCEDGEELVRIGATAFNEMSILREEGRKGRELVRTGALILVFRATDDQWEYRRKIGAASISAEENKGWTHVSTWLPFHYFKRRVPSA